MVGFEKLVLDVKFDDGYFMLIIVEKVNFVELGYIMILVFWGEYIKYFKVIYVKVKFINILLFIDM